MRKILLIAVIAVAFSACGDKDDDGDKTCDCTVKVHPFETPCSCGLAKCDCVTEIQKKFPIEGHNVTIVDGRTNNTAGTPLDASIITGFKTLLDNQRLAENEYVAIVPSGLTIVLRDDVAFDRYDPTPTYGNVLDVNYTFATTNINTDGNRIRFNNALNAMVNLPYDD
jgi:hypothetical protein